MFRKHWKKLIALLIPVAFAAGIEVAPKPTYLVNPNVTDPISVQIKYRMEQDGKSYQDALYFTTDEYQNLTQANIDAEKQKRFDNWIFVINNPVPFVEPIIEELEAMKVELERQLEEINLKMK